MDVTRSGQSLGLVNCISGCPGFRAAFLLKYHLSYRCPETIAHPEWRRRASLGW